MRFINLCVSLRTCLHTEASPISVDLRGCREAKSPAGVWWTLSGVQVIPSFSFSSLAAAGGKEFKSAPMEASSSRYQLNL